MKRYLIYGFLTILIITLNFAFIIVLVSEDVRINYRVLFLLWIVVILAAAGLAYLEKTKKNQEIAASSPQRTPAHFSPGKAGNGVASSSNIYKNKTVKKFKIHLSQDLTPKVEPGFVTGYIINEEYSNEILQAVYTQDDQLLGYLNNKKKRLCENIKVLYNEPVICWGQIRWEEYEKRYLLKGHVPILYSEPEMNRFKRLMESKSDLLEMEKSLDTQNIHTFLKKAENFHYLQQSRITPSSLDYDIPPQSLTNLSKEICAAKHWEELVKLKEYPIVITRLPQAQKEEVLSRIKKAEKKQQSRDLQ